MACTQAKGQYGAAREEGVRHARFKLLVLGALCLLPGIGVAQMAWGGQAWWPLAVYPAASLICLLLYWQDKHQARAQAWRTPEKVLHVSELLGGWPGALVAQQLFRHKTRKVSYQLVFWGIVLLHQVFWVDYLFLNQQLFSLF
ncbi:MAG: DUF1294 domain-containing protein [Pseudomonas sp.]|uniref:DUF1294 domain-containing protein n=1 Tax=Pseudomonas TaxID=286 RepID=UPI0003C08EA1|nr:DUF1294 domain-containing protein [Pseudomonas sp. VLB120]AGZ35491.1 hypothetical protein PVLB_13525 [Pseudomonas sp. VLB120]